MISLVSNGFMIPAHLMAFSVAILVKHKTKHSLVANGIWWTEKQPHREKCRKAPTWDARVHSLVPTPLSRLAGLEPSCMFFFITFFFYYECAKNITYQLQLLTQSVSSAKIVLVLKFKVLTSAWAFERVDSSHWIWEEAKRHECSH